MARAFLALVPVLLIMPLASWAQPWPGNGDFARDGRPPPGWSLDAEAAAKGDVRTTPVPGIRGKVLELAPNDRNAPSAKPLALGQLLPASSFRGRQVVVSARLGGQGGAQAVLGVVALRRGGEAVSLQLRGGGELSQQEDRMMVPADDAIEGLIVFLAAEGTGGMARFAEVAITAGPPPSPERRSSVPFAAQIVVDTSHVVRRIPRDMFGANIEVIRDGNGLWDAGRKRLDPDLVQLAREMGVTMLRFPGGVWSDAYDWRDGVGPQKDRPSRPTHPGASERNDNRFGSDEAAAFARAIGAGLLITVNAASGTPELAAQWVKHMNQEGPGPRVTDWEIGNELYMANDLSGGSITPQVYAERLVRYAAAMKAVDPEIRIAAIGLRNSGRYHFNAHENWDEVVLRRAGSVIDSFAVHDAYAPLVADGAGLDPMDVYAAMWAAPQRIARNLAETRAEIERFAPDQAGRIRIGVTEWGPLFAVLPNSPWVDHVKTLGSAVFVASMIKVLAETPSLAFADFFKLNEASFMGWIGRRGDHWVLNAPGMAFRMAAKGLQPDLLATRVDVATYGSRALGFLDQARDVPYVDAIATAADGGGVVSLLLVNKHPSASATATVTLEGVRAVATAGLEVLAGDAPDANAGTELPVLPGLNWAPQVRAGGRFHLGGEGEVRLEHPTIELRGNMATLTLPPHAVGLLRLDGLTR